MNIAGNGSMDNMRTASMLSRVTALTLLAAACMADNAVATVYIDDAVINPGGWPPGTDYTISLSQTVTPNFSIGISALGNNEFLFTCLGIAELYSLHVVTSDLYYDPVYVGNTTPFIYNWDTPTNSISIELYESVLFGYWDDKERFEVEDRTPAVNDSYGWFELQNSDSGLVIIDGATAVGGGIIAGTYTQIPEPSTIALLLVGTFGLLINGRNKKKFQQWGPGYPPQGVGSPDP